jgi:hypothetical protein
VPEIRIELVNIVFIYVKVNALYAGSGHGG